MGCYGAARWITVILVVVLSVAWDETHGLHTSFHLVHTRRTSPGHKGSHAAPLESPLLS